MWDGGVLRATTNSATDASQARVYVSGNGPQDLLGVVDGFGAGATHYVHQGGERSVFALSGDNGLAEGYLYDGFGTMRIFDGERAAAANVGLGHARAVSRAALRSRARDVRDGRARVLARIWAASSRRIRPASMAATTFTRSRRACRSRESIRRAWPLKRLSTTPPPSFVTESVSNLGALTIDEEEEATLVTAPFVVPQPELDLEDIPDLTSEAHEMGSLTKSRLL